MRIEMMLKQGHSVVFQGTALALPISMVLAVFVGGGATSYAVVGNRFQTPVVVTSPGTATPDPTAPIKITSPPDGTAVRECTTVSGTGTVPSGEALVIATQEQKDNQRYFEQSVSVDPGAGTWSANITFGQDSDKTGVFTAYAILMDKSLADYLSTVETFNDAGNTWWASPRWPAGSRIAAEISVHRFSIDHC